MIDDSMILSVWVLGTLFTNLIVFYTASFFIGRRFNKHFNDIPEWFFDDNDSLSLLLSMNISLHTVKTMVYIKAIALGDDKKVFPRRDESYTNREFRQYAKKWEVVYSFIVCGVSVFTVSFWLMLSIIDFVQTHFHVLKFMAF